MKKINIVTEFRQKAALVSSFMYEVKTLQEALETAVSICKSKKNNTSRISDFISDEKETANFLSGTGTHRTLAAPGLKEDALKAIKYLCLDHHITLVTGTLRNYGQGIDMGLTFADYGIADTGTLVINSDSEEKRLATMLSEIHVALLPLSRIRSTALDMAHELKALTSKPCSYTAFITGASRTADIERILAIGVHGPLELHIILIDDGAHINEAHENSGPHVDYDKKPETKALRS